jgi:glycosyltransferase involved in cell wall biosynthesis
MLAAAPETAAYVRRLRALLRQAGATIVHSNGIKTHILAALAVSGSVRVVWHLHDYLEARPLTATLLRSLVRRTTRVVANSDSVRADAHARIGGSIARIYNAVDLERFAPAGHGLDLAALAGMSPDDGRLRVGLVATFARWKGHDVFLEALSRVRSRHDLRAYVIGGPVYDTPGSQWTLERLQENVEARGLQGVVGFTGVVGDVPAAMRSLDVVVHASTAPEPFGMVIAEGMAAGRAVIAAQAGGAAELFEDGVTALGHAPGDAAALAACVERLAGCAALRDRLGARAREEACRRFSPDRMAAEFCEVYAA